MQTSAYSLSPYIMGYVPCVRQNAVIGLSQLANKTVKIFPNFTTAMHLYPTLAATVFAIANFVAVLPLSFLVGHLVNKKICASSSELKPDEQIKTYVADCLSVGATSYVSNILLSKLTQYQLTNLALLAISVATAVARALFIWLKIGTKEDDSPNLSIGDTPENTIDDALNPNPNISKILEDKPTHTTTDSFSTPDKMPSTIELNISISSNFDSHILSRSFNEQIKEDSSVISTTIETPEAQKKQNPIHETNESSTAKVKEIVDSVEEKISLNSISGKEIETFQKQQTFEDNLPKTKNGSEINTGASDFQEKVIFETTDEDLLICTDDQVEKSVSEEENIFDDIFMIIDK